MLQEKGRPSTLDSEMWVSRCWHHGTSEPYVDRDLKRLAYLRVSIVPGFGQSIRALGGKLTVSQVWPYCNVARNMVSAVMANAGEGGGWAKFKWQRQIETPDVAKPSASSNHEVHSLWLSGRSRFFRVVSY